MPEVRIGSYTVGPNHPPFIVAELSGNHNGKLERALLMLETAKKAGVHAIKLQTYTPDTITLDVREKAFVITDQDSPWKGETLYELYAKAHTPWEWHRIIFDRCRELELMVFSTPFDETAVDFLETLDPPCYKIASLEIIDLPLIRKIAATGKPIIISTGGATLAEIDEAVTTARKAGCDAIIILKCTSAYPAKAVDAHLHTLPHLASCFNTVVGMSDHSLGLAIPIASVALGASMIEKHYTLSRAEGGIDSAFSLEPQEFAVLVQETTYAWQALGNIYYGPLDCEKNNLLYRPSLYFNQDLPAGAVIKPHHIISVRPNQGLKPKELDTIVGLQLQKAVKKGTAIQWSVFRSVQEYTQ